MPRTVNTNIVGNQFSADAVLAVHECPTCGILHAIPDSLDDYLRKYNHAEYPNNYATVVCPAGHSWHITGRNEEQEAIRQRDMARDQAARARAERDQAEASRRAQKGATTRAKRRHAAGVCPVCKRTFQEVQRHMASQHPDFDPSA